MVPDSALIFAQGMLGKVSRDYRAPELAESMKNPQRHLSRLMIGEYDQLALEIAIAQRTNEEVARWIIGYLTDADGFAEDEDEDTD